MLTTILAKINIEAWKSIRSKKTPSNKTKIEKIVKVVTDDRTALECLQQHYPELLESDERQQISKSSKKQSRTDDVNTCGRKKAKQSTNLPFLGNSQNVSVAMQSPPVIPITIPSVINMITTSQPQRAPSYSNYLHYRQPSVSQNATQDQPSQFNSSSPCGNSSEILMEGAVDQVFQSSEHTIGTIGRSSQPVMDFTQTQHQNGVVRNDDAAPKRSGKKANQQLFAQLAINNTIR